MNRHAHRAGWVAAGIALLAAASPLSGEASAEWVRLASDEEHFVAFFPGVAERTRFSRWLLFGRIESVGYRLYREAEGCEISITDLPGIARWLGGPEGIYERAREDLLSEVRGREVAYHEWERSGVAGKRLAWSSDEADGHTEFYIFADHIHVFACYAKRGAGSNMAERFFETLALRDPAAVARGGGP